MRRFKLIREVDVSGVSGLGHVADGILWHDGSASLCWRGDYHTVEWAPNLTTVEAIHGHGGHTRIVWIDREEEGGDPINMATQKKAAKKTVKKAVAKKSK